MKFGEKSSKALDLFFSSTRFFRRRLNWKFQKCGWNSWWETLSYNELFFNVLFLYHLISRKTVLGRYCLILWNQSENYLKIQPSDLDVSYCLSLWKTWKRYVCVCKTDIVWLAEDCLNDNCTRWTVISPQKWNYLWQLCRQRS